MNMKQWVADAIAAEKKKAMPILSFPSIQLMNITVKELISDSGKQAEGMSLIAKRVPASASVGMMDLSVEAEAFGCKVRFSDDEVPTVIGQLVTNSAEVEALAVPPVKAGRTGLYIEAIEKAAKLITDRPVLAGTIGPFSLAGRFCDVSEVMLLCYDEPEMIHALLEKATAFLIEYIKAYKAIGANGVVIAEPLAGLLTPAQNAEFSAPYVKRIVDAVQDETFLLCYHNCGAGTPFMTQDLVSTGAWAFHFGNAVDMAVMLEKMPQDVLVFGNIEPAGLFRNGNPGSMSAAVAELLGRCSKYENYVISSGCDLPPLTPWENIDAFFEAVEKFYNN